MYPLPMCRVIKFEFNPPDPRYSSQGKLTVRKRYTVSQNYTLQNGTGKVFYLFTNSSLPNHTECFFDRRISCIDGNRTDPITVYKKCQLPYCTCQGKQTTPPPKPTPYKPSIFPKWGRGQTQNPGSSQGGDGGQTQNPGSSQCGDGGQTQNEGGTHGGKGKPTPNKGGAQKINQ